MKDHFGFTSLHFTSLTHSLTHSLTSLHFTHFTHDQLRRGRRALKARVTRLLHSGFFFFKTQKNLEILRFFTQKEHPAPNLRIAPSSDFSKKNNYLSFCTQKKHPALQNLKFCMKMLSFFTQKDLPAPQKIEILHEKMTKKVPKRPPSPAKTEILHEKNVFFYTKRPPSLAKN